MSGENRLPKDGIENFIYRSSSDPFFQKKVVLIRREFKIPPQGFKSISHAKKWYSKTLAVSWKVHDHFWNETDNLSRDNKMPITANIQLASYLISGGKFSFFSDKPDFYACDLEEVYPNQKGETALEKRWKGTGRPFVRIYIPRNVGLPTIKSFLNAQWKFVKKGIFRKEKGERSLKRPSSVDHSDLFRKYWKGYKTPETKIKGMYKHDIIAKQIMVETGIKITGDALKKVMQRLSKKGTDNRAV